jgi:DNA processing protein
MSSLKYWVWLSTLSGIGAVTAAQLIGHFGTPDKIFHANERDYMDINIKPGDITRLMDKNVESANRILALCDETGCRVLTLQDAHYPDRLRNIYDPPIVLYVRGNLPHIDDEPVVAVVGTRNCTPYGITTAESISYKLSRNGIIVVTGLARGVDTAATRGALRGKASRNNASRNNARVVGVIGSGPDIVYPPENGAIYDDVVANGAIISEYPPGTPAVKAHFPARNRIISGISLGVAVIEAPKQSGALITAARALEQGRDVFTLPGNVDAESCEGSNALLREGAIPFMSADDIIDEYIELFPDKIFDNEKKPADSSEISKTKKVIDNTPKVDYIDLGALLSKLDGEEKLIAKTIGHEALRADEIIESSGLSAQQVLTALTMLEIDGYAVRSADGKLKLENK